MNRFSEYSMSTYLLCPKKYFFTYKDKSQKKGKKFLHVNFVFGNAVHLTCKDFYTLRAEERNIETLHKLFRAEWVRSGIRQFFKSVEEERELGLRGINMLTNFFNSLGAKRPYQVEAYIEREYSGGKYSLFGRVDRIDIDEEGNLSIIDYKTTKYYEIADEQEKEKFRKNIQLKLYAYLLSETKISGKEVNVSSGSYYHLEENYFDKLDFTKDKIKAIGKEFEEIISDIEYDKTFKQMMGKHCNFCDFKKNCFGDNDTAIQIEEKVNIVEENKNNESVLF